MRLSRRERIEMQERIAYLERQNALYSSLLDQQKDLMHHQRLETIGMMTAGVAHEFNNLLTPIMGYCMMLIEKIPESDTETYDSILAIYDASRKAKKIVSNLSELSRKYNKVSFKKICLNQLVKKDLSIAELSCPKNVKIETRLNCTGLVNGNDARLSQMLLNLLINAFHAVEEDGGTVTVETGDGNDSVWISVSDTGKGIPEELRKKIFDPFYTTKASGKGTGLGLPIAQHVAQEHKGTLTVTDAPGGGACFTAVFPAASNFGGEAEQTIRLF